MPRAIWNGTTLAESEETVVVEGNHYFPTASLKREHFDASDHRSHCGWKGKAHYFHVTAAGETNRDAAWFYPDPLPAAAAIKGHIAFWKGVRVEA